MYRVGVRSSAVVTCAPTLGHTDVAVVLAVGTSPLYHADAV